jgi:hypothetical protein
MRMGAPKNLRLTADFDEWFPQGLFLVGEIAPVMEYQSQEDRARRPVCRCTGARSPTPPRRRSGRSRSRWSSPALISRCHRRRLLVCRFGRWCCKA